MRALSEGFDPRPDFIARKYRELGGIIAFASSKGGVGKSTLATAAALLLSRRGLRTGLLDLDLHGPSCHLMLGAEIGSLPEEDKGLVPVQVAGVQFMSVVYFTGEEPLVMRGRATSDAALELLTITNWPPLDLLLLDLPPGLGDVLLDVGELLPVQFVVVATPAQVAIVGVRRLVRHLTDQRLPLLGVVSNMQPGTLKNSPAVAMCREEGVPYLGEIGFHPDIEAFYGDPGYLAASAFGQELSGILTRIVASQEERWEKSKSR